MLVQRLTSFRGGVFEGLAAESALCAEAETCLVSLWIPFWDVCWVSFSDDSCVTRSVSQASPFYFKLFFGEFCVSSSSAR